MVMPIRRSTLLTSALTTALVAAGCAPDAASAAADRLEPAPAVPGGGNPHAEPEVFAPGVISSEQEEYRITFAPDGRTAYFGRATEFFPASRQAWIYESHRVDGAWTEPTVASFSGEHSDIDPFVSPDGSRLYFSSIRPVDGVPRQDLNTWVVERKPDGWGEAVYLGDVVNSEYDDLYASVDAAGNLYFGSDRPLPGGTRELQNRWNIWWSRNVDGVYQAPEPLGGGVNAPDRWQFNPAVSPDGRRIVFTRLNVLDAQATGFGELHVSHLHQATWTTARNLGTPVNTGLDEFHPSFSPDAEYLFFVRRDPLAADAQGDLMVIRTAFLGNRLRPGFTIGGPPGGP